MFLENERFNVKEMQSQLKSGVKDFKFIAQQLENFFYFE